MEDKKLVAVLNKKIGTGKIMNALAHMTVGMTYACSGLNLGVINYQDQDGGSHLASKYPFIILRVDNSNKIRILRNACLEKNIPFASFTSAMTIGGWESQVARSKTTRESDLEYYGLCLFGETTVINELTRKFSLWI